MPLPSCLLFTTLASSRNCCFWSSVRLGSSPEPAWAGLLAKQTETRYTKGPNRSQMRRYRMTHFPPCAWEHPTTRQSRRKDRPTVLRKAAQRTRCVKQTAAAAVTSGLLPLSSQIDLGSGECALLTSLSEAD